MEGKSVISWLGRHTLVIVICLVIFSVHTVAGIMCYVCEDVMDNSECSQEQQVVNCTLQSPRFDTCHTIVDYSGGSVYISKRCVIGPCSLDRAQDRALALALECTGKKGARNCQSCCKTDRCNSSKADWMVPNVSVICILLGVVGLLSRGTT